jgi:hypothetical protein
MKHTDFEHFCFLLGRFASRTDAASILRWILSRKGGTDAAISSRLLKTGSDFPVDHSDVRPIGPGARR